MQDTYTLSGTREAVASSVRVEMARAGVNQRELAERCGWNQQYVSRRMTTEVAFSPADIVQIATVLDIPVTTFPVIILRPVAA